MGKPGGMGKFIYAWFYLQGQSVGVFHSMSYNLSLSATGPNTSLYLYMKTWNFLGDVNHDPANAGFLIYTPHYQ